MGEPEMFEIIFEEDQIKQHLQNFDPNFANDEDVQALLLEPLA